MQAVIYVWSAVGRTPLTGRGGSFCDELARVMVDVHYEVPQWWNQNTRSGWVNVRDARRAALPVA